MANVEVKNALSPTSIGQFLNKEELDLLVAHSQIIIFLPGEFILQQGNVSPGMYIILEGTALVTAKILGEGGTYIATLGQGNLIGEISLIEKSPCATSVIASTQVQCLLITRNYFEILDLVFPETKHKIARAIAQEVCERLKDIHNKITSFILQAGMITRSMFSEVIQSLTHPAVINFQEVKLDLQYFYSTHLFENFSEEEYTQLLQYITILKAPKHCTLLSQGIRDSSCYIILHGAVQSSIIENNKFAKISVLGPESIFTSISLIEEEVPSIIDYTTCERTILLKVDPVNITVIRKNYRTLWFKFYELVCKSFIALERSSEKLDVRLNSEFYNR